MAARTTHTLCLLPTRTVEKFCLGGGAIFDSISESLEVRVSRNYADQHCKNATQFEQGVAEVAACRLSAYRSRVDQENGNQKHRVIRTRKDSRLASERTSFCPDLC